MYIEEGIDLNSVGEDEKLSNEENKDYQILGYETLCASFVKWGK